MSRRGHLLLIVCCALVGLLELPAAVRSVGETWRGPWATTARAASPDPGPAAHDAAVTGAGAAQPVAAEPLSMPGGPHVRPDAGGASADVAGPGDGPESS